MPADSQSQPLPNSPLSVIVLAWPIALLLFEATLLTPFVEFRVGGMAHLANPQFLTSGIVALAAFCLIVATVEKPREDRDHSTHLALHSDEPSFAAGFFHPWKCLRRNWAVTHILLLTAFAWLTLVLHARSKAVAISVPLSAGWLLLGVALAISILLAFVSLAGAVSIARRFIWQSSIAAAMGVGLLTMTPVVRSYWPVVAGPVLAGMNVMLNLFPGEPLVGLSSHRWPIIGTSRMSLLVTPPCSELDSLLVFVLLAGTLWAALGGRLVAWKYLIVLLVGLTGIYALLSVRLYFMILLGLWAKDPYVAVNFAHSRISTMAFLLYTLAVLWIGYKYCGPANQREANEPESADDLLATVAPEPLEVYTVKQ